MYREEVCSRLGLLFNILLFLGTSINIFAGPVFLKGRILDSLNQKPLEGAKISLLGTIHTSTSNKNGEYYFINVPEGTYNIKAAAPGYKEQYKYAIRLTAPKSTVDFILQQNTIIMPAVTVRPDYEKDDLNEFTGSAKLNREEMKKIPGNLEDVIRSVTIFPGVGVINNYRNDLIVRGGAPSENEYLVDGIILQNINHYASQNYSGGLISFVNMDYVNNINFSSGGFSSLYGDKASSVMDISLSDGKTDRLGGKAVISATQFALNAEGPLTENTNFIVSARRSYLDLVFRASGFDYAPEYYDAMAKITSRVSKSGSLSLLFLGVLDDVKFFNMKGDLRRENPRALGSSQSHYVAALSYRNLFDKGYFNIHLSRDYINYRTIPNMIFDNTTTDVENTFKSDYVIMISKESELNFGALAKVINFRSDINLKNYSTTFDELLSVDSLKANRDFLKAAFYAQYNHTFGEKLKVNLGLRSDIFDGIKEDLTVSPRFFTQYFFSTKTNLSLSLGIYRQTPSSLWIVSDEQNKNLRSIESRQVIASLEHSLNENIKFRAEGFYKKYSHYPASLLRPYLVMVNAGGGFSGIDDNFAGFGIEPLVSAGEGIVKGIELSLIKKPSEIPLSYNINLTYSRALFEGLDGIERPGSFDQTWIVNLSAGYAFAQNWDLDIKFHYATGTPYTPFNNDGTQSMENYNSKRLGDFHFLDLRLGRKWTFSGFNLRTYVDVQNLYNHKVQTIIRWDRKEGKVADDPMLGIVPSLGLSLEF